MMGPAIVAALTPPEIEIVFTDERLNNIDFDMQCDLVATSMMTSQSDKAYEISHMYRNMGIPVVLGGVHVSLMPDEALKNADAVVVGEAESTWTDVINDFKCGKLKKIYSCKRPAENIPFPIWEIFENDTYLPMNSLQVSRGCPVNCDMCSVPQTSGTDFRMTDTERLLDDVLTLNKYIFIINDNLHLAKRRVRKFLDRILSEAKEMGVYFVVISGGEPFFRKDLLSLFEKHHDMSFHVFTHGGLLDEKLVSRLAELGNILPAISVEGFREETDRRRGAGHYDKVVRAMKLVKDAGILFGYSATMTKQNAGIMVSDEFVDHWIENGCTIGWYFLYIPVGREPKWDLVPTPEQRDMLRDRVAYFRATKEMLFGDFWNNGPVVGGCIAGGRKYFHINSKGDVEPCVFCHFALHNIKNVSLRESVTSPLFKKTQEYQKTNKNLLRPCMIIDHPNVYREVCKMPGVYFTHNGAENIVEQFNKEIDEYSLSYGELAGKA